MALRQMTLFGDAEPLTAADAELLDRLKSWVPSGVGAMTFAVIRYQTA